MKKLKFLATVTFVSLSLSVLQIRSLQAADTMAISLIQPDGTKKAMKLNLDQPLSELRTMLVDKKVGILPNDKFLTEMGELSPREEAQWKIREAITGNVLSFKPRESKEFSAYPISIPLVEREHKKTYEKFSKGVLIYRPKGDKNDKEMVKLHIKDFPNPLEGTFNLSRCGDTGKYLSISTGYRKEKKLENAKKVEIWICPRFLIEKELNTTASHFKPIMSNWETKNLVGLFWNNGEDSLSTYDYLTIQSMDNISGDNLYVKWSEGRVMLCKEDLFRARDPEMDRALKKFMFCL